MNEEVIVIGKTNQQIETNLAIWGWEISIYLFLGGLAAGILFFSALYYIRGKQDLMNAAVKHTVLLAPVFIIVGLTLLFIDLHNKIYFWRLYTSFNIFSPMSWGAWTLLIITPLSMLWSLKYLNEIYPSISARWKILKTLEMRIEGQRNHLAWSLIFLSLLLGTYTGILLSAFNARPLWNVNSLPFLFLVSGLSSAAAFVQLMSRNKQELKEFRRIDLGLILFEVLLIIHLFMGLNAGSEMQIAAANLFLGGPFTIIFWIFVVLIGLIIPAYLELYEETDKHVPAFIAPVLVLVGGLILRIVVVNAGQISAYSY